MGGRPRWLSRTSCFKTLRIRCINLVVVVLLCQSAVFARTTVVLVGEEIPPRYATGAQFIFHNSDSLVLNGHLLSKDADYRFDNVTGEFDLSGLETTTNDTLVMTYSRLPAWVQRSYGRTLPETEPSSRKSDYARPGFGSSKPQVDRSAVAISGMKSFRFSARSEGASDFNQSIDLNISGDLTPGLEISGSISDRGYNPSYGTANSRLSELDKVNLMLRSPSFSAQIGDIVVQDRFDNVAGRSKQVSGAALNVSPRNWFVEGAAARPKGRFESFRFLGRSASQGPYQIGEGTTARPVVPGSETVWLDGEELERGANKDYIMDYATGRITLNVNHPIDDRSRVEVDYEPLAAAYKGELLLAGGGAATNDSTLFFVVEWLREGDDSQQPLLGELSPGDESLLARAGDDPLQAVRSGVVPDSLGDYRLLADSLPDSVYQYAGEQNGEFTVTFSYVGEGKGDYRFLGAGRYEFAGEARGEYLPVVILSIPERTDYYNASVGLRSRFFGTLSADVRQTQHDRNLLSVLDDDDNDGLYYSVTSEKKWRAHGQVDYWRLATRHREAAFKTRARLNKADFERRFLLPRGFGASSDETLHELGAAVSPSTFVTLKPFYSRLEYDDGFLSKSGGIGSEWRPHELVTATLAWSGIAASRDSAGFSRWGNGDNVVTSLVLQPRAAWQLALDYEYDSRKNNYAGGASGVRYSRYRTGIDGPAEGILFEYFVEDSLDGSWQRSFRRSRLTSTSGRKLGNLSYDLRWSYQWLTSSGADEKSFLARLAYRYFAPERRFSLSGSYVVSEETRNARGISYLEVEPGEGNYVFEDGQYVPDPDGNFIRTDEILSDQARVRRGEKSFSVSRDWKFLLARFTSRIEEELLPEGSRTAWWLLPFVADENEPYLFFSRRYSADVRLIPLRSGHALNLTYDEDMELRDLASQRRRKRDTKGSVTVRQVAGNFLLEQRLELFEYRRDRLFGGGGNVDGYRVGAKVRRTLNGGEVAVGSSYRRAETDSGQKSTIYSVDLSGRFRLMKRGELRSSLELYRQDLVGADGSVPYLLTDNRSGRRGALWSVAWNYGFKEGMRLNFTMSGRHSDDRTARITARGEVIVGF